MESGYNERLFSGGLRASVHLSRFKWLRKKTSRLLPVSFRVAELGCFDCRSLDYIAEPAAYFGIDANWEGGLTAAAAKLDSDFVTLTEARTVSEWPEISPKVDAFIALETLEHLPPEQLSEYLKRIDNVTDGYIFITIPNETGIIFLLKFLVKGLLRQGDRYSIREFFAALFGKTHLIARDEHKGFSHQKCRLELRSLFEELECQGIPFTWLPPWLNFQVGIVCRTRQRDELT